MSYNYLLSCIHKNNFEWRHSFSLSRHETHYPITSHHTKKNTNLSHYFPIAQISVIISYKRSGSLVTYYMIWISCRFDQMYLITHSEKKSYVLIAIYFHLCKTKCSTDPLVFLVVLHYDLQKLAGTSKFRNNKMRHIFIWSRCRCHVM